MRIAGLSLCQSSFRRACRGPTLAISFSALRPHQSQSLRSATHAHLVVHGQRYSSTWQLSSLPEVSSESLALVFHSTSNNPYHNLALEHYLLTNSAPTSHILFTYTNRPCVVIGRNQNPWLECDLNALLQGLPFDLQEKETISTNTHHLRRNGNNTNKTVPIDLVRRRSGGGTVFHDSGNLNYTVIVPNDKSFQRRNAPSMVVQALRSLQQDQEPDSSYKFGEIKVNERNDIVMKKRGSSEWLKVSGSAFKLTRGRALSHGTLLYSSPYLTRIGGLLRSPGRGLIEAKGVESVRSPVGNLAWMEDVGQREQLRREIMESIVKTFWGLHGAGKERDTATERTLGDEDFREEANSKIWNGMRELMTNDWRFLQTPRFDFRSGVVAGAEVQFHVNHGKVEIVRLRHGEEKEEIIYEAKESTEQILLHELRDWSKTIRELRGGGSEIPDALIRKVENVFPPVV